ncbi:hypothetical protein BHM03_00026490, partial [Ensete ventricosum]
EDPPPTAFRPTEGSPAPYHVPSDEALLHVPPCPTPFYVMPSPFNKHRSNVFLTVMLLVASGPRAKQLTDW